jgi:hypothetical protein
MRISSGHWRLVEPGETVTLQKEEDGFLVDPGATQPGTVKDIRVRKIEAAVTSIREGTAAPVTVRRLRLKAPQP